MMKNKILLLPIALLLIINACNDVKENIATAPDVAIHKKGIMDPKSKDFHGTLVKELKNDLTSCSQCHAGNFTGGTTGVNCISCHPSIEAHKDGMLNPSSPNFHGNYIASINWNIVSCQSCHGKTYTGGTASISCKNCHTSAKGPEACNTCHGEFGNPSQVAPPKDLYGNTSTTNKGVGAHTTHLNESNLTMTYECSACHPGDPNSENFFIQHIGAPPADIKFSDFASLTSLPSYNFKNYTCANVYCHGNFEFAKSASSFPFVYTADKMEGNKYSPLWTKVDGTQAKCGTCHGELDANGDLVTAVPKGHVASAITGCVNCHTGIIDNQGNITEAGKSKHINGQKNVFGS